MAQGHALITTAALAKRLEAHMHRLFRPRHEFNDRFRSADKKGLHTGQPRHLAATSFRYSKTLPNSALFGFLKMIYSRKNAYERRVLMTENKNEAIAVFRFGVIHKFVGGASLGREERLFSFLDHEKLLSGCDPELSTLSSFGGPPQSLQGFLFGRRQHFGTIVVGTSFAKEVAYVMISHTRDRSFDPGSYQSLENLVGNFERIIPPKGS